MTWRFYNAMESFEDFRSDWDTLNRLQNNHVLLDSRFVGSLLRHFGGKHVVLGVRGNGLKTGMALLVKTSTGVWSTFQPSQSPLGLIVLDRPDFEYEELLALTHALPGYPVLLGVSHQDPLHSAFSAVANRKEIEILDYMETPRLELVGGFEEYWEQRGRNLKHNLARQTRRINEQGRTLAFLAERGPEQVHDCIRHYGRLESAGWKADGGTAVHEDNAQGRFYIEVLQDFSRTGEAIVFQLVLDGSVVASDLCLLRDGMLVVLKTTYDETIEKLSPALLMRRAILHHLFQSKQVRVVEFYGKVRDWHLQWTSDKRMMFHVNAFRSSYLVRARSVLKRFRWTSPSDSSGPPRRLDSSRSNGFS